MSTDADQERHAVLSSSVIDSLQGWKAVMKRFWSLPLETDKFIADTLGMTARETGAYIMLLVIAWRSPNGTLPDNDTLLARWAKIPPNEWARLKPSVMSFWKLEGGVYTHPSMAECRSALDKKSNQAKSAADAKWLKIKETYDADASEPHMHPQCNSKLELELERKNSLSEVGKKPPSARKAQIYDLAFEAFWKAYPDRRNNSKTAAFKEWRKLDEDEQRLATESLAAFSAYCRSLPDYRVVHCERYLRDRRFDEWAQQAAQPVFFKV